MSARLHPSFRDASWPAAADPTRVRIGRERWRERIGESEDPCLAAGAAELLAAPEGARILDSLFANSPFLADCLIADPPFALDLLARGADPVIGEVLGALELGQAEAGDTAALMRALRVAKRRVALTVALADIAGAWVLERVTGALSAFADLAMGLAVRHLLRAAAVSGAFTLPAGPTPEQGSGFVVLGLGKLGARELNYSSDIDLIVLYDAEHIVARDRDGLQQTFVRLTRNLVRILEERSADGYVFRTDLRLRPDPASTPLALSMLAAETYYETMGQNWERAALIKARPVAGDLAAGAAFLDRLRPYLWRRHLDFAAIQDIHSIKRQIHAHRGGGTIQVAGHNLKIGRGGIREIEFFAQTQQLIWGGRQPRLRVSGTVPALRALTELGLVAPATTDALIDSYEFLRRTEHRLQMVDDRQTQTLPEDDPELQAFAIFLGYPDAARFAEVLLGHLRRVERLYDELFADAPALGQPGDLVFTGTEDDPGTLATLQRLGFAEPQRVSSTIRGWHHGRYRAMRSVRARELLTEIKPTLLEALARTANPDLAFQRFDDFLSRLPAGVQIFSLFCARPALLDLVAEIMGAAPDLAESLSRNPALLDAVLSAGFFAPCPAGADLAQDLGRLLEQARDFQDVLDLTRRWTNERKFQVGVQLLRQAASPDAAGEALSRIAETVLGTLQAAVEAEFARQHGRLPGAELSIVGLGKLGSREMTMTSDLDLILVFDLPEGVEASDGPKPLAVSLYYARLSARLISALTALTREGRLYDLDMRLRPSGTKGPIAVGLAGFEAYHAREAWTWEHMALTRARPITGAPGLRTRIEAVIRTVLLRRREPGHLAQEVADMRARIDREHRAKSIWDVKYLRGGLVDVEFIAQYLQLRHAADRPEILATNTRDALGRAAAAGVLGQDAAARLIAALDLWHAVQGMLRLTVGGVLDEAQAPPGLKLALAAAAGAVDFADLKARILTSADEVLDLFNTLLPAPASGSGAEPPPPDRGESE